MRLCILAHSGAAGHRGLDTTLDNLKQFHWKTCKEDVSTFIKKCMHCHQVKGGRTFPRPLGITMKATRPNEVISFDWLYIEEPPKDCLHNFRYILTVKDKFSHFMEIFAEEAATAATTARCLHQWFGRYGVAYAWVSDQGSHFKNQVIAEVARLNLVPVHHFVVAYSPWANGSVERGNREILGLLRILLMEMGYPSWHWPYLLPAIQDMVASHKQVSLANECPRKVFMNLDGTSPMRTVFFPDVPIVAELPSADVVSSRLKKVAEAVSQMHTDVLTASQKRADSARKSHDKVYKAIAIEFGIGDYVLHANTYRNHLSKLSVIWKGPYRVIDTIGPLVFQIEDLITKKTFEAHATRLRYYTDKKLHVDEFIIDALTTQASNEFAVSKIMSHRFVKSALTFEFEVYWSGFSSLEATWEPLVNLVVDVKDLLVAYASSITGPDRAAILQAIEAYHI